MKKLQINSLCVISKFKEHQQFKNDLLNLISNAEAKEVYHANGIDSISRSDWEIDPSIRREYVHAFIPIIQNHMKEVFDFINQEYKHEHLYNSSIFWFQQYLKNDSHEWHNHLCPWANVYYLELPKDGPKTLFKDLFGNVVEPDVEEGDVITFPGLINHCSPPNKSDKRKTIISFNILR